MNANELLISIHCHLDDGAINEACRDIRIVRGMAARDELSSNERAWLANLGSMLAACLGGL